MLSAATKGRIGELIAAASIEACGWNTILAPMEHIDIIATRGDKFLRIQVKAANRLPQSRKSDTYKFNTQTHQATTLLPDQVDIVAFVALDVRRTVFSRTEGLRRTTSVYPETYLHVDIEQLTWDNAVAQVLGESDDARAWPEVVRAAEGRTSRSR